MMVVVFFESEWVARVPRHLDRKREVVNLSMERARNWKGRSKQNK